MAKRKIMPILIIAIGVVVLSGLMPLDAYLAMNSNIGLHGMDGIAIASEEEDQLNPVIDYAYVEDGILKLSISDNRGLARKPIIYRVDKEFHSYEMDIRDYESLYDGNKWIGRVYGIAVDIPSTIYITVKDLADNENTYKFTIKEDNAPLTQYIPEFILEILAIRRQSVVNRFEGFDNIFQLQYGKIVNGFSLYDRIIRNNYYSYNKNDINFKVNGLSRDKEGNIKLDKYGLFKISMTHSKDKTFEETAYILIKPDWRNTEDRRAPNNASPYIVYKDKIKVLDYLRYDDEVNNKNKSKIDTTYMLVYDEENNKLYGMNEQINLESNKLYNFSILNFENNSQQDFYIMRQERARSSNRSFSDVDKDYWANRDINSLVSKGLLSGYPDGTFNPTGNITVKEFMTILSRHIALNPSKGKSIVGNISLPINPNAWGYIESKSILDRIPSKDLSSFNYLNIDRPINREEVAFLIDSALELGIPYNAINNPLNDIAISSYSMEIKKLVDLGLLSGYPDGTFKPQNNITRAEIAAIFARIK